MNIHWQEIDSLDSHWLTHAFNLYDEAFPFDVREPHDVFLSGIRFKKEITPDTFHFVIGHTDEGTVASLMTSHYFADANVGFIVYIVTNPSLQNRGVGRFALQKMEEILQQDALRTGKPLDGIILETEKEEETFSEEGINECRRRIAFFERNGFQLIKNIRYVQPPLHEKGDPVPLHLMYKALTQEQNLDFKAIVNAMYEGKYKRMNKISDDVLKLCRARFSHV